MKFGQLRWFLGWEYWSLQKRLKFCKLDLFCELHNEKNIIFYYGRKKQRFSLFLPWSYFLQRWAIWFAVKFKFYLNIFIFLNINTNHTAKGSIFELRNSHLFRDQPYKEVLKVKCQACNFTGVLSFTGVLEDSVTFFRPAFCRTSLNLICNKTTILKKKKLSKILEIGKF